MVSKYSIILMMLLLASLSCTTIRKAERVVLNDKAASERVFRALEPSHPCANDTTFVTNLDTLVTTDTIINYQKDTIQINGIEYITIKEKPKTIVKTVKVHQIHTGYVVDTRALGIALDSVRFYKTLEQIHKDTSKAWRRRFWVLLGAIVVVAFLKYKL